MKSRRDIVLVVIAVVAIGIAAVIAFRPFGGGGKPAPVDPDVLEAERAMTEEMEREAPPVRESSAPPPRREPATP